MENFSAGKFVMGYEKNISFLWYQKFEKIGENRNKLL